MSQRANLALFLVSLFLIVTPDIAALITRSGYLRIVADPGASGGALFDSLVLFLELALGRITHPACEALASDPMFAGPFCWSFMGLAITLTFAALAAAAIIALFSTPRRPRAASSSVPWYVGAIERGCGVAVVLFSVLKVYAMALAYYGPRSAFDGTSIVFCGNFFATGPFSAESCALPMTMYFYLSAATLALAAGWWIYYVISMLRLAFGPSPQG